MTQTVTLNRTRSRLRRPATRAGVVALAAMGLIVSGGGVAMAGAPDFLRTSDLPRHHAWTAGGVEQGVPTGKEFCLGRTIPADSTLYQRYNDGQDATVIEYVHTSASDAEAIAFAKQETHRLKTCTTRWVAQNPDGSAEFKAYDRQPVEDGVASFGVFTYPPQADPSANLFAIGRDGYTVAIVRFGKIGTSADVDVDDFLRTARLATERMLAT